MSYSPAKLRTLWIESAAELDGRDYFARYKKRQRDEVLRKGYLGKLPPDQALALAIREAQMGTALRAPKYVNEMRDLYSVVGQEERDLTLRILSEVPLESYQPPKRLDEPPGTPFIFSCRCLGHEIYFKFQVIGKQQRYQVKFWSCHPPRKEARDV